jgi:hypothetical protein
MQSHRIRTTRTFTVHINQLLQSRYQYMFLPTSAVTHFNCYHLRPSSAIIFPSPRRISVHAFFQIITHPRNITVVVRMGNLSLLPVHQHEDF